MGRWEPDANGRLRRAALELFAERGYEQTTVTDIAERAGVTERTFFRHFPDKREVLFDGSNELQRVVLERVAGAEPGEAPLATVVHALEGSALVLGGRRAYARQRQAAIDADRNLQERELLKLATLATAVAAALESRGTPPAPAALAAETGLALFKTAFSRWLAATAATAAAAPAPAAPAPAAPAPVAPDPAAPAAATTPDAAADEAALVACIRTAHADLRTLLA